eukprot:1196253-Prorocentrum_minimum.AAC.6
MSQKQSRLSLPSLFTPRGRPFTTCPQQVEASHHHNTRAPAAPAHSRGSTGDPQGVQSGSKGGVNRAPEGVHRGPAGGPERVWRGCKLGSRWGTEGGLWGVRAGRLQIRPSSCSVATEQQRAGMRSRRGGGDTGGPRRLRAQRGW